MGEVFAGRYELVDPIGRGGAGAVWRAWDHRRRRYVAAKVLQQRDAHSLLRFVREQGLRIDHPHVLAPTSWAADDDKVMFTMDLVAGGSLVHLVGDYGPLPPVFVCTLLDQLLSGLAAVHADDVVHRDIKPANVLLEATGRRRPRLRLSDFGIAMRLGEPRLTETDLVVGTPGYLAPEQMMGAEPDFAADLFAVGLVALYLLEGAKPDTKALVQYFAEHGTPGAPRGIPEPLWQVVATLLQPDPAARFRTATGRARRWPRRRSCCRSRGRTTNSSRSSTRSARCRRASDPTVPWSRRRTHRPVRRPSPTPAVSSCHPRPAAPAHTVAHAHAPTDTFTDADADVLADTFAGATASTRGDAAVPGAGSSIPAAGSPAPAHLLAAPAPPPYRPDSPTATYTVRPATPAPAPPRPTAPTPAASRHRAARGRRPGPPAAVAVPLLLLALACYAVGFWALARI